MRFVESETLREITKLWSLAEGPLKDYGSLTFVLVRYLVRFVGNIDNVNIMIPCETNGFD